MNTKDDTNEHELEAAAGATRDAATTTITIGEPQPSTAWPSEVWFAALTAQATPAVLAGAARHARAQLALLERLGLQPDGNEEDMTQGLLDAMIGGAVTWDPRVPLGAFLHNKLSDLGARLRRGRRLPLHLASIWLDHIDEDHPIWSTDAMHAIGDLAFETDISDLARRTEVELWERAAGDREALRLLAAMPEAGTDRELVEATGLPLAAVIAAKRRLRRYTEKLSQELQADVRDVLNSGGATPERGRASPRRGKDGERHDP